MKGFKLIILTFLLSFNLSAFDEFLVSDIRIIGLQRVSTGSIFNVIPISVGDRIDLRKSNEEVITTEMTPVVLTIKEVCKKLKQWMKDEHVPSPITMVGMSSFIKYESKKCPLCNEHFLIDSYKTTCQKVMKNKKICGKKCYNNEGLCNTHIRTYLKELQREKQKEIKNKNKKEKASLKRQIKAREKKVLKLTKELEKIQMEIISLSNKLSSLE